MSINKYLTYYLFILINLSGCQFSFPYKEDFDCKVPSGNHCKSLYEINKNADRGLYSPIDIDSYCNNLNFYEGQN